MRRKTRVCWVGLTPKQMADTADLLSFAVLSPMATKKVRLRALALCRMFQAAYQKAKP